MFGKSYTFAGAMGCCSCFGFMRKPKRIPRPICGRNHNLSQEFLLDEEIDDEDNGSYNGENTGTSCGDYGDDGELPNRAKRSEEILRLREQNGMICRQFPVKETHTLVRSEVIIGIVSGFYVLCTMNYI